MKWIFSILLFFAINFSSYSHPHVFFDTEITLKLEKQKLEGVELKLNLDELNTKLNKRILKPDKEMNVDGDLAGEIVATTSLVSIATIFCWILILKSLVWI